MEIVEYFEIAFFVVGIFASISRFTPNPKDDKMATEARVVLDGLWRLINRLGGKKGKG
jgi:hypothetical protein